MRPLLTATFLFAALPFVACDDEPADVASAPSHDGSYTVRGRIADITGNEVSIQHEAIDDFVNREGERVGMATMTMAFHKPDDVSMEGIAVDDLVSFTFEVDWDGDHPMTLRAIEALPPGTQLEL
jgi:Cu/Ag efflux protein CusF